MIPSSVKWSAQTFNVVNGSNESPTLSCRHSSQSSSLRRRPERPTDNSAAQALRLPLLPPMRKSLT
eukprot:m.476216 g.476216  ORF g.476216 m.476216 type:complete len:66 (-) comp40347_c0_seq1:684-881(-)